MATNIYGQLTEESFLEAPDPTYPDTKTSIWRLDACIPPSIVNISANVTSGDFPLSVTFSVDWDGTESTFLWSIPGVGTSTQESPTFVFNSAGTYNVTLTITNECGEDAITVDNMITVTSPATGFQITFEEPGNATTAAISALYADTICSIGNYYSGGTIGIAVGANFPSTFVPSSPGPNYGVVFSGTRARMLTDVNALPIETTPYTGNFANEPSQHRVLYYAYQDNSPDETDQDFTAYINVAAGFPNKFSFYYCLPLTTSTISLYSGVDGTGTLLATLVLPNTSAASGDPQGGAFGQWNYREMTFSGLCKSVRIASKYSRLLMDNLGFNYP